MSTTPAELRLYNTLTRSKEVFTPINPGNVRLYACGPTVYDFAHIGNARPIIVFDLLFRVLRHLYGAEHVTYARNVTDVDDKINARAAERGISIRALTDGTLTQFHCDIRALRVLMPEAVNSPDTPPRMIEPRATDHIEEMKALIERLVQRGVAYVAQGHVLFSVTSMETLKTAPRYGTLARRTLDEMLAGARVDVAPYKRDPMDFVLWKPSTEPNQPGWPSPCNMETPGRPGWHIECSAMSMKTLLEPFGGGLTCDDPSKNVFDIHAGGIDLAFPHHENEIAQSCCALGTDRMATIWMHNGFLMVEGEKMSKSTGNFFTIRELLNEWPGEVLRLTMLKTHYRQPIDWTHQALVDCKAELNEWARLIQSTLGHNEESYRYSEQEDTLPTQPCAPILAALTDDLNFPDVHFILRQQAKSVNNSKEFAKRFLANLQFLGLMRPDCLGIFEPGLASIGNLSVSSESLGVTNQLKAAIANDDKPRIGQKKSELETIVGNAVVDISGYRGHTVILRDPRDNFESRVEELIEQRLQAKRDKNWVEADRLRSQALSMGIVLKDNKDGLTTWEIKL